MELSNEMNVTWRDIRGYEGIYQISDRGVVRSLALGRELKATPDSRGLCRVSLRRNGKAERPYVHQLVMQAFGESANGRKAIAHIDGNAANNSIDNLCWVERTWDKKEAISDEIIRKIEELHYCDVSLSEISRRLGLDITSVFCATKGYSLIPEEFDAMFSSGVKEVEFCGVLFRLSEMLHNNAYVSEDGIIVKIRSAVNHHPKVLKTSVDRNGYETLNYAIKGEEREYHGVHRLVADAFIPRVEGKNFVNHKDGCKTNNRVYNLEWCTKSENTRHAFSTGLKKPTTGEAHGMVRLTAKEVAEIKEAINKGESGASIARRYNISTTNVSSIKNNKIWKAIV